MWLLDYRQLDSERECKGKEIIAIRHYVDDTVLLPDVHYLLANLYRLATAYFSVDAGAVPTQT